MKRTKNREKIPMYKIAVITMGVRLNDEKGYTRFRYIGDFLTEAG